MKALLLPAVAAVLMLGACGAPAEGSTPGVLTADPWVRTTDGAERPEMTALFVNMTNPTSKDIRLIDADCGDVAGMVEIHEMAMVDGAMVMRQAEEGILVPRESHEHLAPGGPHIMLMQLARDLPAGSEEVSCRLEFDNGQKIEVVAPVKEFTEEQDTYHTHEDDE